MFIHSTRFGRPVTGAFPSMHWSDRITTGAPMGGTGPVQQGVIMYQHRPRPTVTERLLGSARTIAAILLTALLASALTASWSDALATGTPLVTLTESVMATGIPVTIEGSIVGASDGVIAVLEQGAAAPVAFPVSDDASLMRGSQTIPADALRVGDTVRMTIDGQTGLVLRLHAAPAASAAFPLHVSGAAALLAAVGLIAGAAALAIVNMQRLPALPARFQSARLLPAAAR